MQPPKLEEELQTSDIVSCRIPQKSFDESLMFRSGSMMCEGIFRGFPLVLAGGNMNSEMHLNIADNATFLNLRQQFGDDGPLLFKQCTVAFAQGTRQVARQ